MRADGRLLNYQWGSLSSFLNGPWWQTIAYRPLECHNVLLIFLRNQSHLSLHNVTFAVAVQKSKEDEKVSLELIIASLRGTGDLRSHFLCSLPDDVDYFTSQMWLLCLTSLTCWAADCLHFLGCHENMVLLFQKKKRKNKTSKRLLREF